MRITRWALAVACALSLGGCASAGWTSPMGGVMLLPCSKNVTVQNSTPWTLEVTEGNRVLGRAESGSSTTFWMRFYNQSASTDLLVRAISPAGVVGAQRLRVQASGTYNPRTSEVFIVGVRGSTNQLQIFY